MVVLAIFVSAIAGTLIIAGSISRGLRAIEGQLNSIFGILSDISKVLDDIEITKTESNVWHKDIADNLNSLKKILAKNFRIAFNDDEFEKL